MNVLGKYINTNSFFHSLDPRIKIYAMLVMIIAILLPSNIIAYPMFGILLTFGLLKAKALKMTLKSMHKMLTFLMIMLLIFNILFIHRGQLLFTVIGIKVYSDALIQTVFVLGRLMLLLSVSMLLTITTKPFDLSLAIEKMMQPLKKYNVPVNEIALIISIALRFIPVFASEALKIMKAQTARGIDFEKGSFQEKLRGILSLIIPLFVSAFQKATDLANAMEVRGYATTKPRTKYRILKYTKKDFQFLFGLIIFVVIVLVVDLCVIK